MERNEDHDAEKTEVWGEVFAAAWVGRLLRPMDSRFRGNDTIGASCELTYPDQKVKVHKRE